MGNILHDLWLGNIQPMDDFIDGNTEYAKASDLMAKKREELSSALTEKEKTLLAEYDEAIQNMSIVSESEAFAAGVRFGIRLMAEVRRDDSE